MSRPKKPKLTREVQKNRKCEHCDMMFLTKDKMQKHVQLVHFNKNSHYCPECPEIFDNSQDFNHHMRQDHKVGHLCRICRMSFPKQKMRILHEQEMHNYVHGHTTVQPNAVNNLIQKPTFSGFQSVNPVMPLQQPPVLSPYVPLITPAAHLQQPALVGSFAPVAPMPVIQQPTLLQSALPPALVRPPGSIISLETLSSYPERENTYAVVQHAQPSTYQPVPNLVDPLLSTSYPGRTNQQPARPTFKPPSFSPPSLAPPVKSHVPYDERQSSISDYDLSADLRDSSYSRKQLIRSARQEPNLLICCNDEPVRSYSYAKIPPNSYSHAREASPDPPVHLKKSYAYAQATNHKHQGPSSMRRYAR